MYKKFLNLYNVLLLRLSGGSLAFSCFFFRFVDVEMFPIFRKEGVDFFWSKLTLKVSN